MSSKTKIVNLALGRIGISDILANVDTERSAHAVRAKLVFDDERDFVLRDFSWPFATRYITLGLVDGSSSDPANADWTFAYRYPSDCLMARRLALGNGRTDSTPPAPFRVGSDTTGRLIYTDQEDAVLEYTARVTDAETFDPLFVSMLAWRVAASLAPSLSRVVDMDKKALAGYFMDKAIAQASAANEGQQPSQDLVDADWIAGR
jgi:hypothetical protein